MTVITKNDHDTFLEEFEISFEKTFQVRIHNSDIQTIMTQILSPPPSKLPFPIIYFQEFLQITQLDLMKWDGIITSCGASSEGQGPITRDPKGTGNYL